MNKYSKGGFAAGFTLLLALAAGAGGASAEPAHASKFEDGKYCATLVGKASTSEVSPVIARACSNASPEEARSRLIARHTQISGADAAAVDTRLMRWFKHAQYNDYNTDDNVYDDIYGSDGPCDSAGYRVEPIDAWKNNLSSILGYNNCDIARVSNKALTEASNYRIAGTPLEAFYLGSYNDNVGLINTYDG